MAQWREKNCQKSVKQDISILVDDTIRLMFIRTSTPFKAQQRMSKKLPKFLFSSPFLYFNEGMEIPSEINQAIFNKCLQIGTIAFNDWSRIHTELGCEFPSQYEFSETQLRKYFTSTLIRQIRSSEYKLDQNSENFKRLLYPFLLKVNKVNVKFKREGPVPSVSKSQIPVQQALIRYKLDKMDNKGFNNDVYNTLRGIRNKSFEIHVNNPEFRLKPMQKSKLCGPSQGRKPRVVATGWANKAGPIDAPSPVVTDEEDSARSSAIVPPPEDPDFPVANASIQDEELPAASPAVEEEEALTQAPTEFSIAGRIFEFDQLNAYLEELIPNFVENGAENTDGFVEWLAKKESEDPTPDIPFEESRMETNQTANQTGISGNKESKKKYVQYFSQEFAKMSLETHALYCKTNQQIAEKENLPMPYPEWLKNNH